MPPTASCCWGSRWCGDGRPGRSARSCGGLETRSCAVRGGPGCGPIAEAGRAAADVRTTNEARESRAGLPLRFSGCRSGAARALRAWPAGCRPARRRAGEKQVAHAQGHVARHDGDQPVDREKHVARAAALAHFAVDRQFEPQIPHVAAQLGEGDEGRSDRRRVVEGLRALPRQPPGDGLPLQVAGREVDAEPHLVVIAVGEAFGDGFADPVDPHHQFALVVHLVGEGGDVEGVVVAQQRRVGLEEPEGFGALGRESRRAVQLLGVGRVISSYADDFHRLFKFRGHLSPCLVLRCIFGQPVAAPGRRAARRLRLDRASAGYGQPAQRRAICIRGAACGVPARASGEVRPACLGPSFSGGRDLISSPAAPRPCAGRSVRWHPDLR
jgi:hypothetical protein